jgi:hypothetical protein
MARIISEMYEKRIVDPLHHGMEVAAIRADSASELSSAVSDADESFMG